MGPWPWYIASAAALALALFWAAGPSLRRTPAAPHGLESMPRWAGHDALAERLDADMKGAMKAGDKLRVGTIRRARAALKNAEIEARGPLSEDASVKVLRGIVKQHRESIEQFRAGGRDDLVQNEEQEMAVIEGYLPAQMDSAALEPVIAEVIAAEGASSPADLGRVMKATMSRLGGTADGKEVRAIAQRLLGGDR